MTLAAPSALANRIRDEADRPGADDHDRPAGRDARELHPVHRGPRRVDQRAFAKRQRRRETVDAANRIDVVLRVRPLRDEAVVAMPGFGAPVVLAEVVAALKAVAAVAAALVRFARDAVARLEVGDAYADFDHLARPLVPGNERVRRGPDSSQTTADDFGIAAADCDTANPAQNFVRARLRDSHFRHFERSGGSEHQSLHCGEVPLHYRYRLVPLAAKNTALPKYGAPTCPLRCLREINPAPRRGSHHQKRSAAAVTLAPEKLRRFALKIAFPSASVPAQ